MAEFVKDTIDFLGYEGKITLRTVDIIEQRTTVLDLANRLLSGGQNVKMDEMVLILYATLKNVKYDEVKEAVFKKGYTHPVVVDACAKILNGLLSHEQEEANVAGDDFLPKATK